MNSTNALRPMVWPGSRAARAFRTAFRSVATGAQRFVPAPAGGWPAFAAALLVMAGWGAAGQSVQHLSVPQTGGMPGRPVLTGIERTTDGIVISWDGPPGYYQVFQKQHVKDPSWQAVGKETNLARRATLTGGRGNAFFRVGGPAPQYAGSQECLDCHASVYTVQTNTAHAQAFATLQQAGQATNRACLPCHTVGQGLPTGFVSAAATPGLRGVQCENCHGPAGNHAANPGDPTAWPRVEVAATLCGGCHTGLQGGPTFEEWQSSGHAQVVTDLNPTNLISSCGRCHSGTVRLSLLEGTALPAGDADVSLGCVVCHDPHQRTANPYQLRNPLASTNDYSMSPSDVFAQKYNAQVGICAQCHNDRGASWTNSSSAPHFSPQYNLLLGSVGELDTGLPPYQPAAHALLITNQCAGCHMQTQAGSGPGQLAVTGHSFRVESYNLCQACHPLPGALVQFTTNAVADQVQQVKAALDLWATTKAPASLQAKYGNLAWEYTNPGDLSAPGQGPSAAEQALIPTNIQKARFNLYLVYHDGSFGVHNGPFTIELLDTALNWVAAELDQ